MMEQFTFLGGLLLVAILIEPWLRRLGVPFEIVLVVLGFVGSELVVSAGADTGIRADSFHDLILYVFLPILVFESALTIDTSELRRNLWPILLLAVPAVLFSTAVIAALTYFGIGHPGGFPWAAALLTGGLLSATDPAVVMALFRRLGVPARLTVVVEGESLFNDALAIVLFSVLLSYALSSDTEPALGATALRFFMSVAGGLAIGVLFGVAVWWLLPAPDGDSPRAVLTGLVAYGAYLTAELGLEASGVMAVLAAGLAVSAGRGRIPAAGAAALEQTWRLLGWTAGALVFLLMGVTITTEMFESRWLAMLIGIGAVLVSRAVVYALLPVAGWLPPGDRFPLSHQTLIFWSGLRGAVTLALALSLPTELGYWWTVQSIAFGVVLFTLFVQAPTIGLLARRLGIGR